MYYNIMDSLIIHAELSKVEQREPSVKHSVLSFSRNLRMPQLNVGFIHFPSIFIKLNLQAILEKFSVAYVTKISSVRMTP